MSIKDLSGRLARWSYKLQRLTFSKWKEVEVEDNDGILGFETTE